MNHNLNRLLETMHAQGHASLSRDDLISALHVFSAPHSLEGIVPVCRHFFEIADRYPALRDEFNPGLGEKLSVLEAIGSLEDAPVEMRSSSQRPDSLTPLYGDTADGPVCDLLLILPEDRSEEKAYERVVAWFVWQALRHTAMTLPLVSYRDYLDSADGEKRPCLSTAGGRLATAFRAIRKLGLSENTDHLHGYLQLDLSLNKAASRRLSTLLRIAQLKAIPDHSESRWAQELGMEPRQYETQLHIAKEIVDRSLRTLLTALWEPLFDPQRTSSGANRAQRIRRESQRGSVRRYGLHDVYYEPVVVGGVAKGLAAQIFPPDDPRAKTRCEDVPEIPTEPTVALFIAEQGDFVRASYTARGLAAAIEYENARLPYARARLSRAALHHLIELTKPNADDEAVRLGGRLLIALSLITGRSLIAAKSWRICTLGKTDFTASVLQAVSADESALTLLPDHMRLVARAGRPDVKDPVPDELKPYVSEHCDYISLVIPDLFRPLIEACIAHDLRDGRRRETYRKEARRLLRCTPTHLAISEKGLREALGREIQEIHRDDLGMVKAISDHGDLNANNLIHYASYATVEAEGVWHAAVYRVLDRFADDPGFEPSPWSADTHVGSYHRFKVDEIKRAFGTLRDRFHVHLASEDHQRAFNALTLYTVLWLNIATCSRGRLNPAPLTLIGERWALVTDKSRADGSTDRIIPLTDAALTQMRSYFDFVWHLAITESRLRPFFEQRTAGSFRFQWFRSDGKLVAFQPKHLESHFSSLIRLPGNFARKLIRAETSGHMSGRFIDAGLGHWVRGRNPWRLTSTMPSRRFADEWTQMQGEMEHRLGLSVLRHPGIPSGQIRWPLTALVDTPSTPTPVTDQAGLRDFEQELTVCDRQLFQTLALSSETGQREPALVKELAIRYLTSQAIQTQEELQDLADELCAFLCKTFKTPIFRAMPAPVLRRDWMIDRDALLNLAHLERHFLPAFEADIACLPPVGDAAKDRLVEYGRLIMVLVWRLDLHSKPGIDSLLKTYVRKPVLGTGDARYIEIQVPGQRQRDFSRRTVFLDDFCRCFLTLEKSSLTEIINEQWRERTQSRRNRWDKAVDAYLEVLGVQRLGRGAVRLMMAAANQRLMLSATPSIAAYASAAWVTHDLDDSELRRQAGLAPRSGYRSELLAGTMNAAERDARQQTNKAATLPLAQDTIRNLTTSKSRQLAAIRQKCKQVKPLDQVEAFIQQYALWLLEREDMKQYQSDPELRKQYNGRVPRRVMNAYGERVQVVGHSLIAFCDADHSQSRIDEELLDALFELSREFMPGANHTGAWFHFVTWLRSDHCPASQFGFEIGQLGFHADRNVSAKIMTAGSKEQILNLLRSARSGIGNVATRAVARNMLRMVDTYGMRRSEAELLRVCDHQGDVLRLQAYDDKTVKTSWAERLLPLSFADERLRDRLGGELRQGGGQLINNGALQTQGFNYFDPVNKAIQALNADDGLRLHHFRHTRITALALSMQAPAVEYEAISEQFPWIEKLLVPEAQLALLLGGGGNAGQGLQAVSAMVGHSHPATSLNHYVHGMALTLHAYHQGAQLMDIRRSFEDRIALSTVQRWVTEATRESTDPAASNHIRRVNDALIARIEARLSDEIHFDATPLRVPTEFEAHGGIPEQDSESARLSFAALERLDRNLRGESNDLAPEFVRAVQDALRQLSEVPSGKRGSRLSRHEMEILRDGQPIPKRLPARTPTSCADMLCEWLDVLDSRFPDELVWLTRRFIYLSRRRDGCVRIDRLADQKHYLAIATTGRIRIDTETEMGQWYARIRCVGEDGEPFHRDHTAVRWVMQYAFAVLSAGQASQIRDTVTDSYFAQNTTA